MDMPAAPDLAETHAALVDRAAERFGRIAPGLLATHVIATTRDGDWPVRKAALEALARRFAFAERDGLRVVGRPPGRTALGVYRTARHGEGERRGGPRPYDTEIVALDPLRTSCGCRDFVRSSLGLCKHGLAVLDALAGRRSVVRDATPALVGRLGWDPVHPLRGPADRLARLTFVAAGRKAAPSGFVDGSPDADVLADPQRRAAFVKSLLQAVARGRFAAEPAVPTVLAEERDRLADVLDMHAGSAAFRDALGDLQRTLYPYQREGVERFLQRGRLLLADDMGLGKTTQAIAICHGAFATRRVRRGLLVVPAALKGQWKREWDATTSRAPLAIVDGSPSERARIYRETRRGFLVIGYEQLLRDLAEVHGFAPEIVVLDEGQRIKNWATKSAAFVKSLQPRHRLVLTGTPMENRFDELASIMDFVDDVALEPKWRLAPWHSTAAGDGGSGIEGARNLDTLRQRMQGCMLRRVRKDVLSQLPARTDTRVPVEMTAAQREEHEELVQPIAVLVSRMARRALTQPEFLKLMRLLMTQRMICNGLAQVRFADVWPRCQQAARPTPALLDELFAPKLSALRGLIESVAVQQRRKIAVFSQWRAMLRLSAWSVGDILQDAGMKAVFFTGAESSKLRERSIIDLHDDPATTVMFLSDAGGTGLNLQRAATCCINLEMPWNPAVLEQRIGRIYRIGQDNPIDVYNLVTEEGIEARIAGLVANKQAVFTSLFDGTTDEVRFAGASSFLESVKALMEPAQVPEVGEDAADGPVQADAAALVDAAAQGEAVATAEAAAPARTDGDARRGLSIERTADGRLRIEAPPELAGPLASLFEQLAGALRSGA